MGDFMFKTWKGVGAASAGIVLAVLMVWLGIAGHITRTVTSDGSVAYEQWVDAAFFGFRFQQGFVPQYERLDAVKVHVDTTGCAKETGEMRVVVLGGDGVQAASASIPISELPVYGWAEARLDARLVPGETSTLVIEFAGCADNGPKMAFLDARLAAYAEQQGLGQDNAGAGVELPVARLAFVYGVPIKIYEYIAYYVFGMMLVLLVI